MKLSILILLLTFGSAYSQDTVQSAGKGGGTSGQTLGGLIDSSPDFGVGTGSPGGGISRPGMQGSRDLPNLEYDIRQDRSCSFRDESTAPDRQLLDDVQNMVTNLRSDPACTGNGAITDEQFNVFNQSIQNARTYAGVGTTGTMTSSRAETCRSYERIFDLQFEQFINNGVITSQSVFASCRNLTGQARTDCAVQAVSNQKVAYRNQCQVFRESISAEAGDAATLTAYEEGMRILRQMISNGNCAQEDGQLQRQLMSSSVNLLSRVTYAIAPLNPLVGIAGDLLSTTIRRFFSGNPRTRNTLEGLQDAENFQKVACLYEMVEDRARGCEARRNRSTAEAMLPESQRAAAHCAQDTFNSSTNEFLNQITQLSRRFEAPPASSEAESGRAPASTAPTDAELEEHINQLARTLDRATNNSEVESPLDLGIEAAGDILSSFPTPDSENNYNEDALRSYAEANGLNRNGRLGPIVSHLEDRRNRVQKTLDLMNMLKQQTDGQRVNPAAVRSAYNAFGEGNEANVSFMSAFNDIMLSRAVSAPDLAERVQSFQTGREVYQMNLQTSTGFNRLIQENGLRVEGGAVRLPENINSGNDLERSRLVLADHLEPLMEREFERRSQEIRTIAQKPIGPTQDSAISDDRTLAFNATIKPLLATCSQLRSVRMGSSGNATEQPDRACDMFRCGGSPATGLTNFQDYLASIGQSNVNPARCSGDAGCQSYYATFMCSRITNLRSARDQFREEFERNGTICGQAVAAR